MQLYHAGRLPLADVIAKFTVSPARLLGLPKGTLKTGADADVTVIDPDMDWEFCRQESASKSKNTPFEGWPMKGKAVLTIVAGKVIWREQKTNVTV
jgi:dihydroorotase